MNKQILRGLVAVGSLAMVGLANAAAGDPDLSAVTDAGTTVAAVGAAVFTVMVGLKVIKWVRRAL